MFVQRINFYGPRLHATIRGAVYCSCPLTTFLVNLLCSDLPPPECVARFVVFTVTRRWVQLKPRMAPVSHRWPYHRIFGRLPCEYIVHIEREKILPIPDFRRGCCSGVPVPSGPDGKNRHESGSSGDSRIKDGIREMFDVTDFDFGRQMSSSINFSRRARN